MVYDLNITGDELSSVCANNAPKKFEFTLYLIRIAVHAYFFVYNRLGYTQIMRIINFDDR